MKKSTKKGFTLVELIIVIAVIGVLAAILIPTFSNVIEKANKKSALSDAKNSVQIFTAEMTTGDGASVIGENTIVEVKKANKDWYFKYYDNGLHEEDGSSQTAMRAETNAPTIPADATAVIAKTGSVYETESAAYTNVVKLDNFPKNVIMYNTNEVAQPTTPEEPQTDLNAVVVTYTDGTTKTWQNLIDEGKMTETKVLHDAFASGGDMVKSVNLPVEITEIEQCAFESCSNLVSATLPGVQTIGGFAFRCCVNLETVTLPEAVTIDQNAFNICQKLAAIDMPKVLEVGTGAFDGCQQLETITAPKLQTIGNGVFNNCENLQGAILPDVKTIGANAFLDCVSMEYVKLGRDLTSIEASGFKGCFNLSDIYYAGSETEWNSISKGADWDKYWDDYADEFGDYVQINYTMNYNASF